MYKFDVLMVYNENTVFVQYYLFYYEFRGVFVFADIYTRNGIKKLFGLLSLALSVPEFYSVGYRFSIKIVV